VSLTPAQSTQAITNKLMTNKPILGDVRYLAKLDGFRDGAGGCRVRQSVAVAFPEYMEGYKDGVMASEEYILELRGWLVEGKEHIDRDISGRIKGGPPPVESSEQEINPNAQSHD
jgi:hypothetical protein